jgi:hypothetical protein
MFSGSDVVQSGPNPGLCQSCLHARRIESDRGSVFFQCKLAFTDPRFAKYPRLPVIVCEGYTPRDSSDETGD